MDEKLDITKLLRLCIILLEHTGEMTISPKTFQTAFKIIYIDDVENLNKGINIATSYIVKYNSEIKIKITTFNYYKKIIKNFLNNDLLEFTNNKYRLGKSSIVYFCGFADFLNNKIQNFN